MRTCLLKRTGYSGIYQNGSLSSLLTGSQREFFFNIYCGNLATLLEANFTILWGALVWLILEFFYLRFVQWAFSSASMTVYPPLQFLSWISAKSNSLCSPVCLCNIGGSILPHVLSSLMEPRKIVGVSVFTFNLLLGWSASFLAPYGCNWNPEVSNISYIYF